jgi:hypothetical protein
MSALCLVPFAVRQRRRGLVRDPAVTGISILNSQWVPAGHTVADRKKKAQNRKIDRILAVLSRFVAGCARRLRFRKMFASNEAWSNIMEREDIRVAADRAARLRDLIVMPEDDLNAHFRQQIANVHEIGKLWDFMVFIRAKRARREAQIEENRQVWYELNFSAIGMSVRTNAVQASAFTVGSTVIRPASVVNEWVPMSFHAIATPVQLHNAMRAAPVRRVTGRFSALDSDDE